jgi:hypothetical protein
LCSGLAACPLIGWSLKKYWNTDFSAWFQFALAVLFYVAGRLALNIWPHSWS